MTEAEAMDHAAEVEGQAEWCLQDSPLLDPDRLRQVQESIALMRLSVPTGPKRDRLEDIGRSLQRLVTEARTLSRLLSE